MKKRTLYFIRHGESMSQVDAQVDGTNPVLSPLGEEQARLLKPKLDLIKPDLVLCSPLIRTRMTMELSEVTRPRLVYHGNLLESEWQPNIGYTQAIYDFEIVAEQNESLIQHHGAFHQRIEAFATYIKGETFSRAVIFAHFGTINHLLFHFLGIRLDTP